jgi:hypothetical protein
MRDLFFNGPHLRMGKHQTVSLTQRHHELQQLVETRGQISVADNTVDILVTDSPPPKIPAERLLKEMLT